MRRNVAVAGISLVFLLTIPEVFAKPAGAAKGGTGTIVIVFKDGHRQSFNLADIERVEFPPSSVAAENNAPSSQMLPPRGHFVGKWEVGDGTGNNFYITLQEGGDAMRSMGDVHGKWVYSNGDAQVTWDDGAQDAIRKVGSHYQKFAYAAGKSFNDTPDNVTAARLTTQRPI